jgi:hypothetical protein
MINKYLAKIERKKSLPTLNDSNSNQNKTFTSQPPTDRKGEYRDTISKIYLENNHPNEKSQILNNCHKSDTGASSHSPIRKSQKCSSKH